jgi:rubrerythrin
MTRQDLDLLDALEIAKAAEQKAATVYDDAAQKTSNPLGRGLFERLAEFERHHYDKLVELEKSLREEGAFAGYEGRELSLPAAGEAKNVEEAEMMSAMDIITMAIEIEQAAEKKYGALAKQTSDATVRDMFKRLAEEEHNHYLILNDVYWNLNNHGVWEWER